MHCMDADADAVKKPKQDDPNHVDTSNIKAQNFTFRELATATKNFRQECFMGEGGFGRVYKGTIPATGQVVAVKQLDRNGMQGSKEFLVEVLMLSLLNHENLVKLTGYCADGDQRLLVYEFLPAGPLERRLLERGPDQPPLDWYTRMKIASHAAKGLWYLHDKANPPVIYRDLKSSNILLDNNFNAKLSDYGLAKLAGKDKMNIAPTRVMGTYGYSAPEYIRTGNLTLKSDVYSFGVVLLELITGRRAVDTTRPNEEQNLVSWAQPIFRDPKRYPDMADPLLKNQFPEKDLNQVVAIAAMCLQEESAARPLMSDVVTALSFLSTSPPAVVHAPAPAPAPAPTPAPAPASAPLPPATSNKSAATESGSEYESDHSESESEYSQSSDEESYHGKNETAKRQVAADSGKYEDYSDASDSEYDYYENENQQEYSPQDVKETQAFYARASRKSSTNSRNNSSDSEDGGVSSGHKQNSRKHLSQKSSKKTSSREGKSIKKSSLKERDPTQKKNSKKHSLKERDLNQKKSSKKHSLKDRDLGHKSSKKKSAVKILSRKKSAEEGSISSRGNVSLSRNSSSGEESHAMLDHKSYQENVSFGHFSSESINSDNMKSHEGNNKHFDHNNSRESDIHYGHDSMLSSDEEGSYRHYDRATSRGSHMEAVHS